MAITLKPIKGYEGYYCVSSDSFVFSLDRKVGKRMAMGREISQKLRGKYLTVTLSKDGDNATNYVHRLVAGAFVENQFNKKEVNHIDGNTLNNSVDNLEWVTHSENVQHAYDIGLYRNKGASKTKQIILTDNEVGLSFYTVKQWCEFREIPYSTGRNILSGANKSKTIDIAKIVQLRNLLSEAV